MPTQNQLPQLFGSQWNQIRENAPNGYTDFEDVYAWAKSEARYEQDVKDIEQGIEYHFSKLELPQRATIYDYLVLGLRKTDIIATFNWDPFLMQAHRRNSNVKELPDIRFLHSSVNFATCKVHDILGYPSEYCPKCHSPLEKIPLIYPEREKCYEHVARDWDYIKAQLSEAFHLTIFGYSGPKTDFLARNLLKTAWEATPLRRAAHAEIIDIRARSAHGREELRSNWKDFAPYYHYMTYRSFWSSSIALWPTKTANWKYACSLRGVTVEPVGPFKTKSLPRLQKWFEELVREEESAA